MIGTWLGHPIVQRLCGPTAGIVGMDPCGGAYVRDCLCGWRCPLQRSPDAAQTAYDIHRLERTAA
jgi:hypothetical protein